MALPCVPLISMHCTLPVAPPAAVPRLLCACRSIEQSQLSGTLPPHLFEAHPLLEHLWVSRGRVPRPGRCSKLPQHTATPGRHTLAFLGRQALGFGYCGCSPRLKRLPAPPTAQLGGAHFDSSLPDAWAKSAVSAALCYAGCCIGCTEACCGWRVGPYAPVSHQLPQQRLAAALLPQVASIRLQGNRLSGPAFPAAWLTPRAMRRLELLALDGNACLSGSLPPGLAWPRLNTL